MDGKRKGGREGGREGERVGRTSDGLKLEADEALGGVGHTYPQQADNDASDCREQPPFDSPKERETRHDEVMGREANR